ncbi:solute carrier family 22 member 6-B-like [Tropilaelaps mercedesae]|uniref:Solute carrier family 22 member 6-B-like n=1 Tax=Tropilaelaps mercedesae TaxID=418985 RepID=A0A1V9XDP9_9ACAR|nr:solute carrier family 22 member 6-B-like [Tropilaelaps mercedesae]
MDHILDNTGLWHYPVLLLNALGGFSYAWHIMALQFMTPKDLDYWCARPNDSISVDDWKTINEGVDVRCFVRSDDGSEVECDVWEYDHSYHARTLTEEWDAVCDRKYLPGSSQSLMMAGMIGSLIFSQLSDWYGRRRILALSNALHVTTGLIVATTSTFWTFTITRMVSWAVTMGYTTLALECVGPGKRALVAVSGSFAWFIGLMTLPLITYNVRDWRMLQIINSLPAVIFAIWVCLIDESPKWLVSAGHYEEASKVLEKVVKRNRLRDVDVNAVIAEAREQIETERKKKIRGTIVDLFRGFIIARTTAIFILNDITGVLVYYYLLYFTVDIGSNSYTNIVFTAITEAPFGIVSYLVIKYARRKPMYSITYALVIAPLSILLFVPQSENVTCMVLALIAKLSGQITWAVIQVHVSEVYSTHVRALAGSFVHTMSRVGAITAPLLIVFKYDSRGGYIQQLK